MSLVQTLPAGPLDIIGDVHGEAEALHNLLSHLSYKIDQPHPQHRKLVFIGDLCDRGPDSPDVIATVKRLVETKQAYALLGNHEINLLNADAKDGSGWFFPERFELDKPHYWPFQCANSQEKKHIIHFLNQLPIALIRDDIRLIHATWDNTAIARIKHLNTGNIPAYSAQFKAQTQEKAVKTGLLLAYQEQKQQWLSKLEDPHAVLPFLNAIGEYEVLERQDDPFKLLTSGSEALAQTQFFSGNRWRFSNRLAWWDNYADTIPVVFGHYWRLFNPQPGQPQSRYSQLFGDIPSLAWHGQKNNVFCVDFSVGARWRDRKNVNIVSQNNKNKRFRLAALQWPERQLVFDDGESFTTENFMA